ncbi:unnamed protein product, partial [Discosporangium mesarthrocarpum]
GLETELHRYRTEINGHLREIKQLQATLEEAEAGERGAKEEATEVTRRWREDGRRLQRQLSAEREGRDGDLRVLRSEIKGLQEELHLTQARYAKVKAKVMQTSRTPRKDYRYTPGGKSGGRAAGRQSRRDTHNVNSNSSTAAGAGVAGVGTSTTVNHRGRVGNGQAFSGRDVDVDVGVETQDPGGMSQHLAAGVALVADADGRTEGLGGGAVNRGCQGEEEE